MPQRQTQSSQSSNRSATNRTTQSDPSAPKPVYRDAAERVIAQAQQYEAKRDYARATPLYRQALEMRETIYTPTHPAITASVERLANVCLSSGDYAQAEKLYQRALLTREKTLGPVNPELVESLHNLGHLYERSGQYAKAEPIYQRALEIQEKKFGPSHKNLAVTLNEFGIIYDKQGQYAKAEAYYQRALAISEKALGANHPDVAAVLNNLGGNYYDTGQLVKAEPVLQRALAIYEKKLGRNHIALANVLENLAELRVVVGNYTQAEPLLERALAVREKASGSNSPEVAGPLINLAIVYAKTGNLTQAEVTSQRAITIVEKSAGPDSLNVALALNNIAKAYTETGNYAQAEPLFQRALSIGEKIQGGETSYVAVLLNNLAVFYEKSGQSTKATQYAKRFEALDAKLTQSSQQTSPPAQNINPIQRYPTIECPDQVAAEQEFAIQISLTEDLLTPEVKIKAGEATDAGKLALALPETLNQEPWKIDVVLTAPGFVNLNSNLASVILPRKGDSSVALFKLRSKPIQGAQQRAPLFVTLWHNGGYLAKLVREVKIVKAAEPVQTIKTASAITDNPSPAPRANKTQVSLVMNGKQIAPDLTIWLKNSRWGQSDEVTLIIDSPYLQPASYTFKLPNDINTWLDTYYNRFARQRVYEAKIGSKQASNAAAGQAPNSNREIVHEAGKQTDKPPAQDQTAALMRGFGRELYQKFAPPAFKEAFWKLADKLGPNFRSIQIYSDNPAIPWELMRPARPDGADERDFLGADFILARWHISQDNTQLDRPPQSLLMEKFVVVAPQYVGHRTLANQQVEVQALAKMRGYSPLRGDMNSLKKLLEDLPQGIIHFAGHGGIRSSGQKVEDFVIRLEDGDLDLLMWRGLIASRNRTHPFFFFNACEIGQTQKVANFVNGWAPAVLEKGASGYIGALWPIGDKGAAEFAVHFYETLERQLQDGPTTVGEVLRKTRKLFLEKADPTYLAYVFYGDPYLTFLPARNQ